MPYRPTVAEVNLAAIRHNVAAVRACVGEVTVLAIVKADGYGHGAIPTAQACLDAGATWLGVATVDEGVELRAAGIAAPTLVVGATAPSEAEGFFDFRLTPTLTTGEMAAALQQAGEARGKSVGVHVKVDTGMGRVGVWHEEAMPFINEILGHSRLSLTGLWTHFATAEADDKSFTREQLARFDAVVVALRKRRQDPSGGLQLLAHAANSAALIDLPASRYDMVRPGIVLYGAYPSAAVSRLDLRPTMTLKSRLTLLKRVPAGRGLGYGRTFAPARDTVIATVPLGYVDGCMRAASNRGVALVRGARCPIVGRVSMDQCLLDVGQVRGARLDDEAVFFGRDATGACLTLDEVARTMETIPHEVLCSVGSRVPRMYFDE